MTKSNSKRSGYAIIDDYSTHRSFPPSLPLSLISVQEEQRRAGATAAQRAGRVNLSNPTIV